MQYKKPPCPVVFLCLPFGVAVLHWVSGASVVASDFHTRGHRRPDMSLIDDQVLQVSCDQCGSEFTETVGDVKLKGYVSCPGCGGSLGSR